MVIVVENEMKDFLFTHLCCVLDLGFYMINIVECRIYLGMSNLISGLE